MRRRLADQVKDRVLLLERHGAGDWLPCAGRARRDANVRALWCGCASGWWGWSRGWGRHSRPPSWSARPHSFRTRHRDRRLWSVRVTEVAAISPESGVDALRWAHFRRFSGLRGTDRVEVV